MFNIYLWDEAAAGGGWGGGTGRDCALVAAAGRLNQQTPLQRQTEEMSFRPEQNEHPGYAPASLPHKALFWGSLRGETRVICCRSTQQTSHCSRFWLKGFISGGLLHSQFWLH